MEQPKWPRFLLGMLLLLATSLVWGQQSPRTYAVVVGIATYKEGQPPLKYTERDASLFAEFLKSSAGGQVPDENIKLLLGPEATSRNVLFALDWLRDQVRENDKVWIYFSGHGDVESIGLRKIGYLLTYETPPSHYSLNAIRIDDLNDRLNELSVLKKAKAILITDACRSGSAANGPTGIRLAAEQLITIENSEAKLASCLPSQLSYEDESWGGGRSVFSYYLLKGLQGEAEQQPDGQITFSAIASYLQQSLQKDPLLTARRLEQTPALNGSPTFILSKASQPLRASRSMQPLQERDSTGGVPRAAVQPQPKMAPALPMTTFFSLIDSLPIEQMASYSLLRSVSPEAFPQAFTNVLKEHLVQGSTQRTQHITGALTQELLSRVQQQLAQSATARTAFNQKFVVLVYQRVQNMMRQHERGDSAELAIRLLISYGGYQLDSLLQCQQVAIGLLNGSEGMYQDINIQYHYLSGLALRLRIADAEKPKELVQKALALQRKARSFYGGNDVPCVQNELGVLFEFLGQMDSARFYLQEAMQLAPNWALPWANLARLYQRLNLSDSALYAARRAKALQPLSYHALISEGLSYESLKNYAQAEASYAAATKAMPQDFLPFYLLGRLCLTTGRYRDANAWFFSANKRLAEGMAIDPLRFDMFAQRLRASRSPIQLDESVDADREWDGKWSSPEGKRRLATKLRDALDSCTNGHWKEVGPSLKMLSNPAFGLPLVAHYYGEYFLRKKDWKNAETWLLKAAAQHATIDSLWMFWHFYLPDYASVKLKEDLSRSSYPAQDDYLMLGGLAARQGRSQVSLSHYNQAAKLEEKALLDQAREAGLELAIERWQIAMNDSSVLGGQIQAKLYKQPVKLLASQMMMAHHLKLGDYRAAEKVLLAMIALGQDAGFLRDETHAKKGYRRDDSESTYWLELNGPIEAAAYEFYQKAIKANPRQPYWQLQAARFLYQRLSLSYQTLSPNYFEAIAQYNRDGSFPWGNASWLSSNKTILPGAMDTLVSTYSSFDPIQAALQWLEEYEERTRPQPLPEDVPEALARLYSWRGDQDKALRWFAEWVTAQPTSIKARKWYADYLGFCHMLPDQKKQLEYLESVGKNELDQQYQLAMLYALEGQVQAAIKRLQATTGHPDANPISYAQIMQLAITCSGDMNRLEKFLQDSMPARKEEFDADVWLAHGKMTSAQRYAQARLAVQKGRKQEAEVLIYGLMTDSPAFYFALRFDPVFAAAGLSEFIRNAVPDETYIRMGFTDLFVPETLSPFEFRSPPARPGL